MVLDRVADNTLTFKPDILYKHFQIIDAKHGLRPWDELTNRQKHIIEAMASLSVDYDRENIYTVYIRSRTGLAAPTVTRELKGLEGLKWVDHANKGEWWLAEIAYIALINAVRETRQGKDFVSVSQEISNVLGGRS